jgi:predicted DNA-binding transcriptional regulator YafY
MTMPEGDRPRRPESDRRLRQAARFARVLRVLQLIQGRSRYDINDLARDLECSTRTVFRDLNVLELAGVPWYHDESQRCYRVRPDFRFPTVNLTDDELVGQATATAISSSPNLDVNLGATPTTRKISTSSRDQASQLLDDARRITSVLDLKLADHSRHQEIIRTVQWALIQGKQLTGTYASPYESKPKRLTLHPYRLCLVKQAWYLIARAQDAEQARTFRSTRFQTLRPIDAPSVVPADFDLKDYFGNAWGVYRGDQAYDVEIHFSPDAADLVTETTWHPTQKVQRHRDGGVTFSFHVDGLNEIVHWVLGWSGRATVVRPPELRELVVEHLHKALSLNQANLE